MYNPLSLPYLYHLPYFPCYHSPALVPSPTLSSSHMLLSSSSTLLATSLSTFPFLTFFLHLSLFPIYSYELSHPLADPQWMHVPIVHKKKRYVFFLQSHVYTHRHIHIHMNNMFTLHFVHVHVQTCNILWWRLLYSLNNFVQARVIVTSHCLYCVCQRILLLCVKFILHSSTQNQLEKLNR